jgi:hypothetical protein
MGWGGCESSGRQASREAGRKKKEPEKCGEFSPQRRGERGEKRRLLEKIVGSEFEPGVGAFGGGVVFGAEKPQGYESP